MPWDDIFEPAFYKCWTEALQKEQKIRMKWHKDYEARLQDRKLEQDETAEDDGKEVKCTCGYDDKQKLEKGGPKLEWPRSGAVGTSTIIRVIDPPSQMKPPEPEVRNTLYDGISHDGEGRALYLKKRSEKDPEGRFYEKVCNSWVHGWNHGKENEFSCRDPEHCNIREIAFHKF